MLCPTHKIPDRLAQSAQLRFHPACQRTLGRKKHVLGLYLSFVTLGTPNRNQTMPANLRRFVAPGASIVLLLVALVASIQRNLWPANDGAAQSAHSVVEERNEPPDIHELRARWFIDERMYPTGTVSTDAMVRARAYLIEHFQRARNRVRAIPSGAWTPVGPAPDNSAPSSTTGRIRAIAIHPQDPRTIYLGSASGGVWKTTDDGATWQPLTDGECTLSVGALAIDSVNPRIVYAGTGEPGMWGCGILRSVDDGQSWTQIGSSTLGASATYRLLIDSTTAGSPDRTTLFVATTSGTFRTTDGGNRFEKLSINATDLVMDPGDPRLMYAAASGLFRTTNGGTSWTQLRNGLPSEIGFAALAIDPASRQTVFAAVTARGRDGLLGIFRSVDAGESWTPLSLAGVRAFCGSQANVEVTCRQCSYNLALAVDPVRPKTLYFGEILVYRSNDGGESWRDVGTWRDPCRTWVGVGLDNHELRFDQLGRLYLVSDLGVHRSIDGADSWQSLNTNLSLRQFYPGLSLHPTNPSFLLAGAQDGGVFQYRDGTWQIAASSQIALFGDGGYTAIDPINPNVVYAEHQWNNGQGSAVSRSDSGGGNSFVPKTAGISTSDRASFIPPLVMDPGNSNRLAFGTERIYLTENRAESWSPISPSLSPQGVTRALAFAPTARGTLYAGTTDGKVFLTQGDGDSWLNVTGNLPNRVVTHIAVAPGDGRTVYVTLSGFGTPHVLRSRTGGQGWENIGSGLPDVPANTILLDPDSPTLLLGTDIGVFRSDTDGGTWDWYGDGLPNVAVTDVAWNPRLGLLVASTYGRGLYAMGPICLNRVSPLLQEIPAIGGRVTFSVTGDCSWTASVETRLYDWIRLTAGSSGRGNGTVTLTADPNTGSETRDAQIAIAGRVGVVRQKGR